MEFLNEILNLITISNALNQCKIMIRVLDWIGLNVGDLRPVLLRKGEEPLYAMLNSLRKGGIKYDC